MKKIIVPTDFSDQAQHALDLASEIATKTGAKKTRAMITLEPNAPYEIENKAL